MVELTCCPRVSHPTLKYGVGTTTCIPRLLCWNCVNDTCGECGIEHFVKITKCPILAENNDVINVLEWVHAPRQGFKKDDSPNTQLELGHRRHSVKDVLKN